MAQSACSHFNSHCARFPTTYSSLQLEKGLEQHKEQLQEQLEESVVQLQQGLNERVRQGLVWQSREELIAVAHPLMCLT